MVDSQALDEPEAKKGKERTINQVDKMCLGQFSTGFSTHFHYF